MISSNQLTWRSSEPKLRVTNAENYRGISIAFTIFGVWAISSIFLQSIDLTKLSLGLILVSILWQMFLYTGLFITAHDAMHGAVFPQNLKINHSLGAIAVFFYGLFSYNNLLKKHWLHHNHPGSELDPDFHDGQHKNFFAWYFHFMKGYWSWTRLGGLAVIFILLHYGFNVAIANIILFWALPSILSSVQLFYFGTFLTHREPAKGYSNIHRAESTRFPIFWSFITCYHFGYHKEHHEYPHVPWWQLPEVYQSDIGHELRRVV